jgi:hypothetical protein
LPTHIVEVQLADFTTRETFIDTKKLQDATRKKTTVNSFLKKGKLFSLIFNDENIRIVTQDTANGKLLGNLDINRDNFMEVFPGGLICDTRVDDEIGRVKEDRSGAIWRALSNGAIGIVAKQNDENQMTITIATNDVLDIGNPARYGAYYTNGYYNPSILRAEANPIMMYRECYCSLLTDIEGTRLERGKTYQTISEQLSTQLQDPKKKGVAVSRFVVNGKLYRGYYSKKEDAYLIEEFELNKN